MQNIHLINSFNLPLNDFLIPQKNLPSINALYGEDCSLLFPNLPGQPISAFFSDYLNHYLIFYEDEIREADKDEPYFTLPFLINFACLSKSGDIALLVSGSFPNDVYTFDVDSKELVKFEYNDETNNYEQNQETAYNDNFNINDTDDDDIGAQNPHQCDTHQCNCNKKTSENKEAFSSESVTHASFRDDNKLAAIATKSYVHTILIAKNNEDEISIDYDQQGRYEDKICNPCGVTWNPQGTWLAFGNQNQIIFVEKNCRLRQIYDLDDKSAHPVAVSWSPHRDILAFMDDKRRLYILAMKNRVIYRKYTITAFEQTPSIAPQIFWSRNQDSLSLGVLDRSTGLVNVFEFNFSVDRNESSIFVFNGNTLHISDWCRSLIPPPLSHRHLEFGDPTDQITCLASNNEETAVFTLNAIYLINSQVKIQLDGTPSPVQCATFSKSNKNVLSFACGNIVYSLLLESTEFTESFRFESSFVSFLTPSYVVTSRNQISQLENPFGAQIITMSHPATEFVQNNYLIASSNSEDSNNYVSYCADNGSLYLNRNMLAANVKSFILDEKLLAYICISSLKCDIDLGSSGWMCHIKYGAESTSRQIEPNSQLLFFSKKIFSVISLMNRGNIEINAPHVIVEAALRELIRGKQYSEALRISKKYQIPFSRFIDLGEIFLNVLCEQIPDSQLRSCMSVLRLFEKDSNGKIINESIRQMNFVLDFLSFILGVKVEYKNKSVVIPPYEPNSEKMKLFGTTCCICFVLLESPVEAVRFACSFSKSENVKECITFLLTLYDNDSLYDISLKTYDTNCMASVGLITMKEPSSYVQFIEELDKTENENLRLAKIDEAASDPENAIIHYSKAGPEYDTNALYIIERDSLFDVGLSSYPENSDTWIEIIKMKLDYLNKLNKKDKGKHESEIASTAILSHHPEIILNHLSEIVKSRMLQLVIPILTQKVTSNEELSEIYNRIKDMLESLKLFKEAALFTTQYIPSKKQEAANLFLEAHEWYKAIENGADLKSTALLAFDVLSKEATGNAGKAKALKERFDDVKEKQKIHKDSNIRHGKNKEKRGLPAIVSQLSSLLPDENKTLEFNQVSEILKMIGEDEKCDQLRREFRDMVKSIYPIPRLPENEEIPVPAHLVGIV